MVNQERLQLFLDALRSGEFVQGTGNLREEPCDSDCHHAHEERLPLRYCCLGVATEVAIANGCAGVRWNADEETFQYLGWRIGRSGDESEHWADENCSLPPQVQEWFGFDASDPVLTEESRPGINGLLTHRAIWWNDDRRVSFTTIADLFEARYKKEVD